MKDDSKFKQTALLLVVAVLMVATTTSCELSDPPAPVVIERDAFLGDVSLSTTGQSFMQICLDAFQRVMDHVATTYGTVSVETIDGSPLTSSRTPIDVRFSVAEQFRSNEVYEGPLLDQQKASALEQMDALLKAGPTTRGTDVLAAIELAERILMRPPLGKDPERRSLVICSDLINTSEPINFYALTPSPADTERVISQLRDEGRLPEGLAGVHVYLVGAGQPTGGRVSADQARAVESFFRGYFEAVGAEVELVAATLPSFP